MNVKEIVPFELWEYQRDDVEQRLEVPGRLCGMEMGTGKTFEALAFDHILHEQYGGMTLVVCKLSGINGVFEKWYKKLLPHLKVCTIDPKNRNRFVQALRDQSYDVYICHWDSLRFIYPELMKIVWVHIIADECHRLNNRKNQWTVALKKIKAVERTGLSGSLVTTRPDGLWSPLNWLYKDKYRSYWKFYKHYCDYEIVYPQGYHKLKGVKNEEQLHNELEPFFWRHLVNEPCCEHHPQGVMPWMPEKFYAPPIWVELTEKQRKVYNQMDKDMLAWVGEHEDTPLAANIIITKMIRLQQMCLAYPEIYEHNGELKVRLTEPSSKLDALFDLYEELNGEQLIVFSTSKQIMYLAQKRLADAGISHGMYTGDQTLAQKNEIEAAFQEGRIQVFLGTIRAGGETIDLTRGCNVVFLDRDWSPMANKQAEARPWRGGQERAVYVHDIIARDTCELGRHQRIEETWAWIRRLLGDVSNQRLYEELDNEQD